MVQQTINTQSITSPYSFAPAATIYGTCTLSIRYGYNNYYYGETVTIQYQSKLTFVTPTFGLIRPGTWYNVLVVGTSGTNAVSIDIFGHCSSGQTFTNSVPLGVSTSIQMASNALGTCTLTAGSSIPNFLPATTKVQVYNIFDKKQITQATQSFFINDNLA